MAKMVTIKCACGCGRTREVRLSDRKRGWGKYYSKSCKATAQEMRTGQYAKYKNRQYNTVDDLAYIEDSFHPHDPYSLGQS